MSERSDKAADAVGADVVESLRLTIAEIETIPIRVPLARVFRGSHYSMTHRSTIICRVKTHEGVIGEAWAGDEDAGLGAIDEIIHTEIAPALVGADAFAIERCWQSSRPVTSDILRDKRLGLVACACVCGTQSASHCVSRFGDCGEATAARCR